MKYIQSNVTGRAAFSIEEVIEATGFCRDTVYKAIRSGKLVARKYGRRTIVLPPDLQRFLESLPRMGGEAA